MKFCYITFRSVTFAQRGERLLKKKGIRCDLRRTPKWMEEQGCGYSLRLREEDTRTGADLLTGAGVPLRKIYCQGAEGRLEERMP